MAFSVETESRLTTVDVTDRIAAAVPDDLESFLRDLVPDEGHAHDELDGNADSHLRAALIGPDVTVPVADGALALGTWQSVLLVECDGPRTRTVSVTSVGD